MNQPGIHPAQAAGLARAVGAHRGARRGARPGEAARALARHHGPTRRCPGGRGARGDQRRRPFAPGCRARAGARSGRAGAARAAGLRRLRRGGKRRCRAPELRTAALLGAYTLFFAEKRDTPEELGLLFRSISEHLGMALENTRLLRENMRMTLMSERQLIANEVHDSLAQTMAYMKIRLAMMQEALEASEQARALKHTTEVQQALDGAYADLRELLSQFRNRMDPLGLVHALQELQTKYYDRTGIVLVFDNRTTDLGLSVEEESQVFHIMQEALANVARHSGAKHARLTMELVGGEYRFAVEDDGLGFFAIGQRLGGSELHPHLRHHLGVNIMRERAQRLNGSIEIVNLPQGGARVSLVFPAQSGATA